MYSLHAVKAARGAKWKKKLSKRERHKKSMAASAARLASDSDIIFNHWQYAHVGASNLSLILLSMGYNASIQRIQKLTSDCLHCVRAKTVLPGPPKTGDPSKPPVRKFNERVGMDYLCLTVSGPYVLVAVDHYTSFSAVCHTVSRNRTASFQAWRQMWVAQHGWPKYLRSDGESGFTDVISVAPDHGCVYEKTSPDSSHSNGVAERMIRHLRQLTRAMIISSGLPKSVLELVWFAAVDHACRASNNTPRRKLDGRTPAVVAQVHMPMPGYFFGQPVFSYRKPLPGSLSKFESNWRHATYLCMVHSGKCGILVEGSKMMCIHPRRVRSIPGPDGSIILSDSALPEAVRLHGPRITEDDVPMVHGDEDLLEEDDYFENLDDMMRARHKSGEGVYVSHGSGLTAVAPIVDLDSEDFTLDIHVSDTVVEGAEASLAEDVADDVADIPDVAQGGSGSSPRDVRDDAYFDTQRTLVRGKGSVDKTLPCSHPDHGVDPFEGRTMSRCPYRMCRFHCILSHAEDPSRVLCGLHGYTDIACERYAKVLNKHREKESCTMPTSADLHWMTCPYLGSVQVVGEAVAKSAARAAPWSLPTYRVHEATPAERAGMLAEINGWRDGNVFTEISDTEGQRLLAEGSSVVLTATWVLKWKKDSTTDIKARLVLRGFQEPLGDETFAPTVGADSVRGLIAVAALRGFPLSEFDVSQAFIQAPSSGLTVLIRPPMDKAASGYWRFDKNMYGRRNAPQSWYKCFRNAAEKEGWFPLALDPCVFIRRSTVDNMQGGCVLALHVDDGLAAGLGAAESMSRLPFKFGKGPSVLRNGSCTFAGIQVVVMPDKSIVIHQTDYVEGLLSVANIERHGQAPSCPLPITWQIDIDSSPLDKASHEEYRSLVGKLVWPANCTRPDISLLVSTLSRYLSCPTEQLLQLARRGIRYLTDNPVLGIRYQCVSHCELVVYSDATWSAARLDNSSKSQTGYIIFVEYPDNSIAPIAWKSKRQSKVARSSHAAELFAFDEAIAHGLYLRELIGEMLGEPLKPLSVLTDNQSLVDSCLPISIDVGKDKSLRVAVAALRDLVSHRQVRLGFVAGVMNPADDLTKPTYVHKVTSVLVDVRLVLSEHV